LRGYGHVSRKNENDSVKMHGLQSEVKCIRSRGRPKKTWTEDVVKDCQTHQLNKEDAKDHSKCRKLMKDIVQYP